LRKGAIHLREVIRGREQQRDMRKREISNEGSNIRQRVDQRNKEGKVRNERSTRKGGGQGIWLSKKRTFK